MTDHESVFTEHHFYEISQTFPQIIFCVLDGIVIPMAAILTGLSLPQCMACCSGWAFEMFKFGLPNHMQLAGELCD